MYSSKTQQYFAVGEQRSLLPYGLARQSDHSFAQRKCDRRTLRYGYFAQRINLHSLRSWIGIPRLRTHTDYPQVTQAATKSNHGR
jgi:hypothetical protein